MSSINLTMVCLGKVILLIWSLFSSAQRLTDLCGKNVDMCPITFYDWSSRERDASCPDNKRYSCMENNAGMLTEACMFVSYIPPNATGCPIFGACDPETGLHIVSPSKNKPCNSSTDGCPPSTHDGYNTTVIYRYRRCITKETERTSSGFIGTTTSSPDTTTSGKNTKAVVGIVIGSICSTFLVVVVLLLIIKRNAIRQFIPKRLKPNTQFQSASVEETAFIQDVKSKQNFADSEKESGSDRKQEKEYACVKDVDTKEIEAWVPDDVIMQETIPLEIIRYLKLEGTNVKHIVERLESPMFNLLTKAPTAIEIIGQLHFLAWRFCAQFEGEEDDVAKELLETMAQMASSCKSNFQDADNNVTQIKHYLTRTMQRLSTLITLSKSCSVEDNTVLMSNCESLVESIQKCKELAEKNEHKFREMYTQKDKVDSLLQSAQAKINNQIEVRKEQMKEGSTNLPDSPVPKGGTSDPGCLEEFCRRMAKLNEKNNEMLNSLQKLKESFHEAVFLSEDLSEHWKSLSNFFGNFCFIIIIYLRDDVKVMNESLLTMLKHQDTAPGEPVFTLQTAMKVNSLAVRDNAAYAKVISELYLHVSQNHFDKCCKSLNRLMLFENGEGIDGKIENLKETCEEQKKNIEKLCKGIVLLKGAIDRTPFREHQ